MKLLWRWTAITLLKSIDGTRRCCLPWTTDLQVLHDKRLPRDSRAKWHTKAPWRGWDGPCVGQPVGGIGFLTFTQKRPKTRLQANTCRPKGLQVSQLQMEGQLLFQSCFTIWAEVCNHGLSAHDNNHSLHQNLTLPVLIMSMTSEGWKKIAQPLLRLSSAWQPVSKTWLRIFSVQRPFYLVPVRQVHYILWYQTLSRNTRDLVKFSHAGRFLRLDCL